jgi:segregation and condensation protein B
MEFDLKRILRSLLFATSEPLTIKDVQRVLTQVHEAQGADDAQGELDGIVTQVPNLVTGTQIRDAADALRVDLESAAEVVRLREGPKGFFLVAAEDASPWVRLLRGDPKPQRLTAPVLETLAIVAYRQPVTRSEIEAIRGVSADSALTRLQERELVHVVGRAELPGRPLQYATTEAFLDYVGIRSLEELPASDALSPRALESWLEEALGRKESAAPNTADVGLPDPAAEESDSQPDSASEPEVPKAEESRPATTGSA